MVLGEGISSDIIMKVFRMADGLVIIDDGLPFPHPLAEEVVVDGYVSGGQTQCLRLAAGEGGEAGYETKLRKIKGRRVIRYI